MVRIAREGEDVLLRLSAAEAKLLSFALRVGYETESRAEYWIRSGVTQSSVRNLQKAISKVASGAQENADRSLEPGVETEEIPRHARPTT